MMDDFMTRRLTEDAGASFAPSRYGLISKNDAIVQPYKTYELFFEITFHVIQKLGAYEDIGTPEECRKAMGVQNKVGDCVYFAAYDENFPESSSVCEFKILDASAEGLIRIDDGGLSWVNVDDPDERMFWTEEEAEEKLEELKCRRTETNA